jgi:hypothetical protein
VLCGNRQCRLKFRRHRDQFFSRFYAPPKRSGYLHARSAPNADKSPTKSKSKIGVIIDRRWRIVAGPTVSEINLRIPIDPDTAARLEYGLRPLRAHLDSVASATLIQPQNPPVNTAGGYKFSNAPKI